MIEEVVLTVGSRWLCRPWHQRIGRRLLKGLLGQGAVLATAIRWSAV